MDASLAACLITGPTLDWLENDYGIAYTPAAEQMLLAIALQESNLAYREQVRGPARGFFQFESAGGVRGVLTHKASAKIASAVCKALVIAPEQTAVYNSLSRNDVLACAFARLLLFTDPKPMPTGINDGYDAYIRCWRPGRPRPDAWPAAWNTAKAALAELG